MDAFKALAEDKRREIIAYLKMNPDTICCDIAKHIGKDVSTTFRHLIALEEANLITARKEGKFLRCSLKNPKKIKKLFELAEISI